MYASGKKPITAGVLDWQNSVSDIVDNTAAPPAESVGARYLLDATGGGTHANWDGAAVNDIVEFDGVDWNISYDASANEGGVCWVEDEDTNYTWTGTAWVRLGSTVTHNNTAGLQGGTTDEYYHLTTAKHGFINQDVTTTGSPVFAGGEYTGVVKGVTPVAGADLVIKEYVDLALGARKHFFLSDTGSGVGALDYCYPRETGEAESTEVSASLGAGDAQLVKGYITEAGEPGTTTFNAGVIAFDIHAKKGASNHRETNLYCVVSWVDADGVSNKTTIATSELCFGLTDTEQICHLHASVAAPVEVASTARLIIEVFANVGDGAIDSVVTLYMEGVHDSHFDLEVTGGIWQSHDDALDSISDLIYVSPSFIKLTAEDTHVVRTIAETQEDLGLGAWTEPTFSAGDYTASGAMTWTVEEADVVLNKYQIIGKTVVHSFNIQISAVAGTLSTTLNIAAAGNVVQDHHGTFIFNQGSWGQAACVVSSTQNKITLFVDFTYGGANWANYATTYVRGTVIYEIA